LNSIAQQQEEQEEEQQQKHEEDMGSVPDLKKILGCEV